MNETIIIFTLPKEFKALLKKTLHKKGGNKEFKRGETIDGCSVTIGNLLFNIDVVNAYDPDDTAYQIYEGDKSGNGQYTMADCFQRNQRTKEYLRFFEGLDVAEITVKKNFIHIEY